MTLWFVIHLVFHFPTDATQFLLKLNSLQSSVATGPQYTGKKHYLYTNYNMVINTRKVMLWSWIRTNYSGNEHGKNCCYRLNETGAHDGFFFSFMISLFIMRFERNDGAMHAQCKQMAVPRCSIKKILSFCVLMNKKRTRTVHRIVIYCHSWCLECRSWLFY